MLNHVNKFIGFAIIINYMITFRYWGQNRKWQGNYLSISSENSQYSAYNASINNMKNSDHFKTVMFSAFVMKFNRCNKSAERAVIVTETGIYKIDGEKNKFKNMKRSIAIKEVSECFDCRAQ